MKILTWQARRNKKITLIKLSEASGISKSTLNNIENERVSPSMQQMESIAKALNMRITELFESDYK
jgi:transcriptional regulator with XRE-family HTH domain